MKIDLFSVLESPPGPPAASEVAECVSAQPARREGDELERAGQRDRADDDRCDPRTPQ